MASILHAFEKGLPIVVATFIAHMHSKYMTPYRHAIPASNDMNSRTNRRFTGRSVTLSPRICLTLP